MLTYAILPLEGGVEIGPEGGVDAELALRHRELGEHVGDGRRLLLLASFPSLRSAAPASVSCAICAT